MVVEFQLNKLCLQPASKSQDITIKQEKSESLQRTLLTNTTVTKQVNGETKTGKFFEIIKYNYCCILIKNVFLFLIRKLQKLAHSVHNNAEQHSHFYDFIVF